MITWCPHTINTKTCYCGFHNGKVPSRTWYMVQWKGTLDGTFTTGLPVFWSTPPHKKQEKETLETRHTFEDQNYGLNIDLGWVFLSLKKPVWVYCSQKVEDLWGRLCSTEQLMNLNVHCSRRRVQEDVKKIKPWQPQQLSENRHLCDPHNVPQTSGCSGKADNTGPQKPLRARERSSWAESVSKVQSKRTYLADANGTRLRWQWSQTSHSFRDELTSLC